MPFNKPTLVEIVDRIKSDLKARITGAATFLRNSVLSILSIVFGAAVHLLYDYLEFMKDQLFVSTADTKYLELQGSEYGITRSFGAYATGTLTATGTDGTVVGVGARLQTSLGVIYISQEDATIAGSVASISVQAELVGSAANASAGTSVTFISPIPGVNTSTTVDSGGLINGSDSENDDALRDRILTRKRQPPSGGTEDDYIVWAKEVSGVTRAWSFPQLYGSGTIGVAFSRDNDTPITPSEAERADVRSYIVSHEDPLTGKTIGCPVTAEPGLFIIALQPLAVNFYIKTNPYNATVVSSMQDRLDDLLFERGGPGESITISQMYEAITAATGEISSVIISPEVDSTADFNQIHVLGDVVIEVLQ